MSDLSVNVNYISVVQWAYCSVAWLGSNSQKDFLQTLLCGLILVVIYLILLLLKDGVLLSIVFHFHAVS